MKRNNIKNAYFFNNNHRYEISECHRIKFYDSDNNELPFVEIPEFPKFETLNNFIFPFFANRKTRWYSTTMGKREADQVSDDLRNITSKVQKISNPSHPRYKQFIEYVNDILGFQLGVIPYTENQSNTGIYVNDNEVIPIDNMGEGVVNILGLIIMLLTEDNKLYLIEELENDIHPRALKKLLDLILAKSTNNQFIISTHSNIVLKYLGTESSKIFELKWQPFELVQSDRTPTTSINEIDNKPESKMKLLESLGYDLFDFDLYKSYIIFEESSAETLVRDFLIPTFFPDLVNKVRTLAATGADDLPARFHDFLRLFVFVHQSPIYNSRAWVIADGDETGVRNINKLKEKFPTLELGHFISLSKSNIEEFYPLEFQDEFSRIRSIMDTRVKREQKIQLNMQVMVWVQKNPIKAKEQFSVSAKELLNILNKIATVIE